MSKSPEELEFERQKHRDDIELRRREIELRELQERRSGLHNPLVLAILAAVAGLITNAVVAWLNGRAQNELEDKRAQAAQIIEAIKTGDPDVTAENLRLFVETGLIRDRASQITAYLAKRKPGEGARLPASGTDFPPTASGEPFLSTDKVHCAKHLMYGTPSAGPYIYCRVGYAFGFNPNHHLAERNVDDFGRADSRSRDSRRCQRTHRHRGTGMGTKQRNELSRRC